MTTSRARAGQLLKDLGDGLTLRRSRAEDAEALEDFNARIQSDKGPDKPDERVRAWTYDLLSTLFPRQPSDLWPIL